MDQKIDVCLDSGQSKQNSEEEKQALHYAMKDGAMYPTKSKEEPWKEVKLGRVFKESDLLPFSEKRNFIKKSIYVAHLGEAKDFIAKFKYQIASLKNLVFINEGGPWIWNWIESSFPQSTQILDYYHAKEHLCDFAKEYFKDPQEREKWLKNQSATLLNKTPQEVIANIELLPLKINYKKEKSN